MTVPNPVSESEETVHPYGEAGGLVLDIVTASMNSNFETMDRLYEGERRRRQALEVLVDDVLGRLETAWGGTAREYEKAVRPLRFGASDALADRHAENGAR